MNDLKELLIIFIALSWLSSINSYEVTNKSISLEKGFLRLKDPHISNTRFGSKSVKISYTNSLICVISDLGIWFLTLPKYFNPVLTLSGKSTFLSFTNFCNSLIDFKLCVSIELYCSIKILSKLLIKGTNTKKYKNLNLNFLISLI